MNIPITLKLLTLIIFTLTNKISAKEFTINFITELTFNLDTKISTLQQGISLNYETYTLYIIYQKPNIQNNEIIITMLSKEITNKTYAPINKIYLINPNDIGFAFEKYLKTGSTLYLEFPSLKNLNYSNLYYYHKCSDHFYLKFGFDNTNLKKNKIQKIIGFYLEF